MLFVKKSHNVKKEKEKDKDEVQASGLISSFDLRKPSIKFSYVLLYVILGVISVVCLFPPLWILLSSFKDINEFLSIPPTIIPKTFHPEKLVDAWKSLDFTKYYVNTFVMAIGDLGFCLVFNGICGYVLSRLKPKGHQLILALILWTMMMPTGTSMVPLFMTFLDFPLVGNITNTYFPMWIISAANPFFILVFKSFFDSIPMPYIEAAKIDGCTNMGIFAKIIMPMSKPVLMVVSIFSVSASWDNFLWPYLVLKDTNLYTVTVKLFSMKTGNFSMDMQVVAIVFTILAPAILFMFFQKHIMTGFNLSGVKG